MNSKIKDLEQIVQIVNELKRNKKIIVTNNGSYDMLHVGHIRSLQEAKKQGDILIVGVNSESSIKEYKSKDRPIIDENSRAEVVAALECVDYVFIFSQTNPIHFLSKIRPHVHTNSAEYGEECIEKEVVEKYGGTVYLIEREGDCSTTAIIEKIMRSEMVKYLKNYGKYKF